MTRLILTLLLLSLGACAPHLHAGSAAFTHTGISGSYSALVPVSAHRHHTILAQGMVIRQGSTLAHAVALEYDTASLASPRARMRADAVWSFGRELAFEPLPADLDCAGLLCRRSLGVILFTASEFEILVQSGLSGRVLSSDGPIDIYLPATLFQSAQAG